MDRVKTICLAMNRGEIMNYTDEGWSTSLTVQYNTNNKQTQSMNTKYTNNMNIKAKI